MRSENNKSRMPRVNGRRIKNGASSNAPIPQGSIPQNVSTYNGQRIPVDSFLELFKYKQFARNYALTNNLQRAYQLTFGDDADMMALFGKANAILNRPEVQLELERLMPTDEETFKVLREGLMAPVEPMQKWSEKHKFMETAMKLKGLLKDGDDNRTQVNIGMVVEEVVHEKD